MTAKLTDAQREVALRVACDMGRENVSGWIPIGVLADFTTRFLAALPKPEPEPEPVAVEHRKPITGKGGFVVGYSDWEKGEGLNWWPRRVLYAESPIQSSQGWRPIASVKTTCASVELYINNIKVRSWLGCGEWNVKAAQQIADAVNSTTPQPSVSLLDIHDQLWGKKPAALADDVVRDAGTQAAKDVLAERQRQKEVEAWTPEHDDQHDLGQLSAAAECYAGATNKNSHCPVIWPWDIEWWKPSDYRRNLVKAGALIIAEIERIDRAAIAAAKGEK